MDPLLPAIIQDAALAASVFHDQDITIPNLKHYLTQQQIPIRPNPLTINN